MNNLKARLFAWRFPHSSVPVALLALSLLSYGVLIPWLGYYWDDLAFIWIAEKLGTPGLTRYFASARPVWGLFIRADLYLLGSAPWVWHVFGIFWRWLSAVMLWSFLRLLWPQQSKPAAWAAFLFLIYPGFDQQFIPVNFGHFFLVLTALLFSFGASLVAARKVGTFWRWTAPALFFSAVNLLCMEYFYLLELLRPVLLWLVLAETIPERKKRLRKTLVLWAPYLALFLGVSAWRAFFFENQTLGNQPKLLAEIAAAPWQTLLQLAYTVLHDLWLTAVQAWGEAFRLPNIALLGQRTTLLYAILTLASTAALFVYFHRLGKKEPAEAPTHSAHWPLQPALLGMLALAVAGWPFWITQLVVGLRQPNSRFTLPFTLGAVLLVVTLVACLPRRKTWLQAGALALLIGASVGYQFQLANSYRRAFDAQKQFFWQMTWRIPELKEGVALLVNDLSAPYATDNSLTAMLNWIYAPENNSERMSYILYFPSIRQNSVLQGMEPDRHITHNYWAAVFYGNTSQVVAVNFQPPGCLRVLDPQVDPTNPTLSILMRKSAQLSSWQWIQPSPSGKSATPPQEIYGSEPPHGWCYYYQKAELARQQGDWQAVAALGEQAFRLGDYPNDPAERYPFIEAYAHLGDWERALELTQEASAISPLVHPPVCHLWERIAAQTPPGLQKETATAQVRAELNCE